MLLPKSLLPLPKSLLPLPNHPPQECSMSELWLTQISEQILTKFDDSKV